MSVILAVILALCVLGEVDRFTHPEPTRHPRRYYRVPSMTYREEPTE